MLYEFRNDKVVTKALEYSVAYHCNMRCSGCSHMSPFLSEQYPSLESFASDIVQLSNGLHAGQIRLCGGEPLLNPQINSFIKIAQRSGIADSVNVTTNGLVLDKMDDEFWASVDSVVITLYPGVRLKEETIERFKRQAEDSDTKLILFSNPVFRTTIVTEPQPKDLVTDLIFKTCENVHLYHCHTVHEGKLYKCAVPPFLPEYLARMGMAGYDPAFDAFDIHGARNVYEEVKSFLLCTETLEACRYCLGYLGKTQDHHQLESGLLLDPGLQNITRKSHFDFHKLNKLLKSQIEDCDETKFCREAPRTSGEILGPKCSVVIPVHNRARHIRCAVNSVLNQSFQDFEIIITDDCSTDETVRIVQELAGCDPRIKLFRHKRNMGAQAARNTGTSNATGQYIAFLDSDDEWLPERLRLGFEVVDRESVLVVHSAGTKCQGEHFRPQEIMPIQGNIYADVLADPGPMFQGLLVKKECLERIDGLDESIISWQEWDTVIRLAREFEFGYVSVPCFVWHRHDGATISQDQFRSAMGYYQIVEKHRDEMLRVAGTNAVMEHYLKILAWLRNTGAYNEFQEVKTKLSTLIKTVRSNEAATLV